jgi:hypothetical protein
MRLIYLLQKVDGCHTSTELCAKRYLILSHLSLSISVYLSISLSLSLPLFLLLPLSLSLSLPPPYLPLVISLPLSLLLTLHQATLNFSHRLYISPAHNEHTVYVFFVRLIGPRRIRMEISCCCRKRVHSEHKPTVHWAEEAETRLD